MITALSLPKHLQETYGLSPLRAGHISGEIFTWAHALTTTEEEVIEGLDPEMREAECIPGVSLWFHRRERRLWLVAAAKGYMPYSALAELVLRLLYQWDEQGFYPFDPK